MSTTDQKQTLNVNKQTQTRHSQLFA